MNTARASAGSRLWGALLLLLLVLQLVAQSTAWAQVPVPKLDVPVEDRTGTLSQGEVDALSGKLQSLDATKGARIAIVVVPTTAPETIEQFAIRVAEQRTLGRQGVDDGVLIVVAKDDRAVRIEVGLGLQGVLPDVLANRITDQVMVPRFREGKYYAGLDAAVDRIVALLQGEALPPPEPAKPQKDLGSSLPVLLMLVLGAGSVLRRTLGGLLGSTAAAGIAGVLAWFITGAFIAAIGAAVVAFIFTLFGGGTGGGGGWSSGRGYGGGFGGGGFGGGSWGGGGGTFNGGGATGRW